MYKLEELETYRAARNFRNDVALIIRKLPKEEQYALTSQLKRSSRSIAANISEGYGRFHFQENIQFCRQARGSLFETFEHLAVAFDENYISGEEHTAFKEKCEKLLKLLNGYIKYLKNQKANSAKPI